LCFIIFLLSSFYKELVDKLFNEESNVERLYLLNLALNNVNDNPIFGPGSSLYYLVNNIGPHNQFAQVYIMSGFLGLLTYIFMILFFLNKWFLMIIIISLSMVTHNMLTSMIYLPLILLVSCGIGMQLIVSKSNIYKKSILK
jgi:O-antigen ligase